MFSQHSQTDLAKYFTKAFELKASGEIKWLIFYKINDYNITHPVCLFLQITVNAEMETKLVLMLRL